MPPDMTGLDQRLPAQRGGAKALLLTVLGEFVLPAGGSAWTSSLIAAAGALEIGEKNARQAIARIGEEGLIRSERHGRRTRWVLTGSGTELLQSGAERIYRFGTTTVDWQGQWLVAHCPVAESKRALRNRLRTRLAFLGFGELSASLLISPHVDREPQLRQVLAGLDLLADSLILRSTTATTAERDALVERSWDLGGLERSYVSFQQDALSCHPVDSADAFRALVELVHDWRRFPSVDPELPTELLPANWAGTSAAQLFQQRRDEWSPAAQQWFTRLGAEQRRTG